MEAIKTNFKKGIELQNICKMSKILITGGGGYVGSMLSTALVNLGHDYSFRFNEI